MTGGSRIAEAFGVWRWALGRSGGFAVRFGLYTEAMVL